MQKKYILGSVILICFLLSMLSSCRAGDADKWYAFQQDQHDDQYNEQYNAIIIEFEESNVITFFLEEQYGIWEKNGHQQLIQLNLMETLSTAGPIGEGYLQINLITPQTYCWSVIYGRGAGSAAIGEAVFSSHTDTITYSDNGSVATITPNERTKNKITESSQEPITMRKVLLPAEQVFSFEQKIDELNFVPNEYYEFLNAKSGEKYVFEAANIWVDAVTKIGKLENGSLIIPVKMEFSEKVPYVKIYDISGSVEKCIFDAYVTCEKADSLKIEIAVENEIFYANPLGTTILKTTE